MEPDLDQMKERRSYFRIDDDIVLQYRLVSEEDIESSNDKASRRIANSFTIKARFAALEQKLRPVRNQLEQHSEELVTYLKTIDEKLDLLADIIFETGHDLINMPTQRVSLSAGGTSFYAQKPLELGALLQLWLLLPPSKTGIITYATVAYCKRSDEQWIGRYAYKIGVEFKYLREEDSDLIIRHVLNKEADERRRMKSGQPAI